MKKSAAAYRRKNALLLHAESQTTAGVWIASPPFEKLDSGEDVVAIGQTIIKMLEASEASVPHPTKWDELFQPMLDLAGDVKSWTTFCKGACCVSVDLDDGKLTISPNKNAGAAEGFTPLRRRCIYLRGGCAST